MWTNIINYNWGVTVRSLPPIVVPLESSRGREVVTATAPESGDQLEPVVRRSESD